MSSRTAVVMSALAALAGTSFGQAQQNTASPAAYNFYITTPQTGQQISGGTASAQAHRAAAPSRDSSQHAAQSASSGQHMNLYISQQQSRVPAVASTSARAQAQAASTRRISQNRRAAAGQNFYTNANRTTSNRGYTIQQVSNPAPALASRNPTSRYANSRSNIVATSARQPNFYTQSRQTNPAYVSNASASSQRPGFFSRIMHPHQHTTAQQSRQSAGRSSSLLSTLKPSRLAGRIQEGMASWYGSDWDGKKTANGERYDMNSMTAAHKTLPFGTMVRVRNESNGRECVVRINNRGPFAKGRILDLSKAAASTLGMIGAGVAKVKFEVIGRS